MTLPTIRDVALFGLELKINDINYEETFIIYHSFFPYCVVRRGTSVYFRRNRQYERKS